MGLDISRSRSDSAASREIRFRGTIEPLIGFLFAFALYAIVANKVKMGSYGLGISTGLSIVGTMSGVSVMGIVVWFLLKREGLRPRDLGFGLDLALPGIVAVGGLWLGLNAIGVGLATATGTRSSIGYGYDASLLLLVGLVIEQYLFVGLLEELAFRGYLQNKLIALLGGGDGRARTALGIATTSAVFAAMHIPNRLFVDGLAPEALAASLALLTVSAVVLGILYELTRNVFFVGLLHGTGNLWPLFVDPGTWPSWLFLVWIGGGGVLLGATVWSYRQWIGGTRPTGRRRPVGSHR